MSGGRSRHRDKLRSFFTSSSSTPKSANNVHTPDTQSPSPSRSASSRAANRPNSPSHSTSQPPPPPPNNRIHRDSHDILQHAWQQLSDHHRKVLEPHMPSASRDTAVEAMEQSLVAAKRKQQQYTEKRLKLTFAGRPVVLKEAADKVVHWLIRLKPLGDIAASANPVHFGLPWSGVCLVLQAVATESKQIAALLVGCEIVLYTINRLKVYTEFLVQVPSCQSRTNFKLRLTELHALVLSFLAQAIETYQRSTAQRVFACLWQDSDALDFEQNCDKVGNRVEIEAQNCGRTLSNEDRKILQRLQETLEGMKQNHSLQASLKHLETKIDLGNLKSVKGAAFDAYGQVHHECHSNTRVDLLHDIKDWAREPKSQNMFWLQGMAGTGKSTISYTIAKWLSEQGSSSEIELGASFFFKRDEGDRASAVLLFPTLVHQLVRKVPGLDALVAEAVDRNPDICSKALGEQFQTLIYEPLEALPFGASNKTYIVVVDALDECKTEDADVVLQLWSRYPLVRLRLFLTSRPDLPIRLQFGRMSANAYRELTLHNVPLSQVQCDILAFLRDEFAVIRENFNDRFHGVERLNDNWPAEEVLCELASRSVPLFIVASTICLFVADSFEDPLERLDVILHSSRKLGQMSSMGKTYLPVLQQLEDPTRDRQDQDRLYADFRIIVGSIVTLAEPLSKAALSVLLRIPEGTIALRLQRFSSVLHIPSDTTTPVRRLHLSFGEFLTSCEIADQPFSIDSSAIHRALLSRCLELLSRPGPLGLHENMCCLSHPGQPRRELTWETIQKRLPSAIQYACRYWIHHAQSSGEQIVDHDEVHAFLQKHFSHWLEALSLLNCTTDAIAYLETLRSLLSLHDSANVTAFLEDARRFVLRYCYVINIAPLQLYSSAIIFAPQDSIVRNQCGRIPSWTVQSAITPTKWGLELQQLEGHTDEVTAVAFSPESSHLASASTDGTVRLWNTRLGQEVQKLEHANRVNAVVFSNSGIQLASASFDRTARIWDTRTGQEVQKLQHPSEVSALAFSPDGTRLASTSGDHIVRLWDIGTGQVRELKGHTSWTTAVVFSLDGNQLVSASDDQTIRLWDARTGQEVQKLRNSHRVNGLAFSPDGAQLAFASIDGTVRLWEMRTGQVALKLEHDSSLTAIVFSPSGRWLASASFDRTARIWDAETGQEVQKLEGHTSWTMAVAFSPDGNQLASASRDQTVRLWDVSTRQKAQKLEGHADPVMALAFSPDGNRLASTSTDKIVRLWNARTGQVVQKLEGHTDIFIKMAFSPDGRHLALASVEGTVQLWNVSTGEEVHKLEGHTLAVVTLVFSLDGSRLASASWDATLRLWNTSTGHQTQVWENRGIVWDLQFTRDGKTLLTDQGTFTTDVTSVSPQTYEPTVANETLAVRDDWIECRGKKLLWLPPEYRTKLSAVHNDQIALGRDNGTVTFLELRYE